MTYTFKSRGYFNNQLAEASQIELKKFGEFLKIYNVYGLSDFSKYPGKISPSWSNLSFVHPDYQYAKDNSLWHYHIGLPSYRRWPNCSYQTSDKILHFQWPDRGNKIYLVEIAPHSQNSSKILNKNQFTLPTPEKLE